MSKPLSLSQPMIIVLMFVLTACNMGAPAPTATPLPTNTPVPPTNTPLPTATPTNTPMPTATPNVAATQQYNDMFVLVQQVVADGYIPSTNGEFIQLDDFKMEMAQINYYDYWPTGQTASNFIFKAHFKWSNAVPYAELSGCGLVFGMQSNGDHYFIFLGREKLRGVLYNASQARTSSLSTYGNRDMNYGNPAEADFALIVFEGRAYVYLEGAYRLNYFLYSDNFKLVNGDVFYAMKSGTNKDYGTRCEMTNVGLWHIQP